MSIQNKLTALVPMGLALLVGGHAFANPGGLFDGEDDEEKAKKEWREAEEGQQGGEGQGPGQGGPGGMQENPLDKIIEMMIGVEEKLFEADTGGWTQEEQREIVKAMRFEDKTSQALEELIRKIEEEQKKRQQQSSSSSQDQQDKQQQDQQNQNETEEEKKERERKEREKQQREKEEEKRRQQNEQQQQDKQQNQNDQQPQGQQQREEDQQPQGQNPDELNESDPEAGAWGRLPKKLHQDANNARNAEPPSRWRELIERYRIRLAEED